MPHINIDILDFTTIAPHKTEDSSIHLYVRHINSYMSDLSMLYRK
jgi:hypothetical protein